MGAQGRSSSLRAESKGDQHQLGLGSRRTHYTVGGHTNTEHTCVVSGERRGGNILAGKAAAVTRESGEVAAYSLAREGRRRQSLALGLRQRENSETVAKKKQLPSAGLDSMRRARTQKYHVSTNY